MRRVMEHEISRRCGFYENKLQNEQDLLRVESARKRVLIFASSPVAAHAIAPIQPTTVARSIA